MTLPANRNNYCPNPGFEGITKTTFETNYVPNPSITDLTGYTGGSAALTASTAWALNGTTSLQISPNTAGNDTFASVNGDVNAVRLGLTPGTWTFSATIRLAGAQAGTLSVSARSIAVFTSTVLGTYTQTTSTAAPNAAGVTRLSVTFTVPAAPTEAFVRLYNGASTGNGDVFWDSLLLEQGSTLNTYFDGSTAAAADLAYAWTGTANNSTSVKQRVAPTVWTAEGGGSITSSITSPINGTYSGTMAAGGDAYYQLNTTPAVGDYWTLSVAYKTSGTVAGTPKIMLSQVGGTGPTGTTTLPLTLAAPGRYAVTIGPLTTGVTGIKAALYAPTSGGVVYFDQAQLEKGNAATAYFDGTTPADTNSYYSWTGAANASTSTAEYRGVWVEQRSGGGAPSVQITVSGMGPAAGTVQVTRTADGETWTVPGWFARSVVDTDTDPDFAVPLGRLVTYTVFFNGAQTGQMSITVPSATGWIQSPYDPASAMPVNILNTDSSILTLAKGSLDTRTHASNASKATVMGAKRQHSISGQRIVDGAALFILNAWKNSTSDQFKTMATAPILLIRGLPSWGSIPGLAYTDAPAQEYAASRYRNYPRDGLTQWTLSGDLVQPVSRKPLTGSITNAQVQTNLSGITNSTILARSGAKKNVDIKANPLGL